jgi:hypothetical protein
LKSNHRQTRCTAFGDLWQQQTGVSRIIGCAYEGSGGVSCPQYY